MISVPVREENELAHVARALEGLLLKDSLHIITLEGDLGAGKTALTKALARNVDIKEEVTSPTFVIMKSYPIPHHAVFDRLIHMDAYRIDTVDELRVLGFENILSNPKNLLVIEWPERIQDALPSSVLPVHISITSGTDRLITYGY